MPALPPRAFTAATGALFVASTALIALGVERLVRGAAWLGYTALALGLAAAAAAFSMRIEGDPREVTLLLVTREACPLCDEARIIVEHVQEDVGFSYWEVDVAEHAELSRVFGDQVPVLVHEGVPVASLQVREDDVRGIFADAR